MQKMEFEANRDTKVGTFREVKKVRNSRKQHKTSGCEELNPCLPALGNYGAATTYAISFS